MADLIDNKYLANKYDLNHDHFWKHGQSGKWIISHVGCMIIADKEGIKFSKPEMIQGNWAGSTGSITMFGYGSMADKNNEGDSIEKWSHGEVNEKNCHIAYPYAVAEKRLKDRLTLMLISAYGDVYSEIEADEFAAQQNAPKDQ